MRDPLHKNFGQIVRCGAMCILLSYAAAAQTAAPRTSFNTITREELEMLVADIAKTNPMVLRRLSEDPEMKQQQINNLRQLLAFASEAVATGVADEPVSLQELENIRAETAAVNYDKEINKDKGPMPPFGFITDEEIRAFWLGAGTREVGFQRFLAAKLALLKASDPLMSDRELTDEEKQQARDFYAKVRIYQAQYNDDMRAGRFSADFQKKIELQVKLQQAQFLARLMSERMSEKTKATDAEVAAYIAAHSELDTSAKRAKALAVLKRAHASEDFAKLANEFSEDAGNIGAGGKKNGGLYKNVKHGTMLAPFEIAALKLAPGAVSTELVESAFGYHIIKLERKGTTGNAAGQSEETYDVRHILFSTGVKDPENPLAREMPLNEYARREAEKQKESRLIDEMVARNKVSVPDDFTVPTVTDAELEKLARESGKLPSPTAAKKKTAPKRRPAVRKRPVH